MKPIRYFTGWCWECVGIIHVTLTNLAARGSYTQECGALKWAYSQWLHVSRCLLTPALPFIPTVPQVSVGLLRVFPQTETVGLPSELNQHTHSPQPVGFRVRRGVALSTAEILTDSLTRFSGSDRVRKSGSQQLALSRSISTFLLGLPSFRKLI